MKKIIIIFISIILIVLGILTFEIIKPNIKRTCEVLDTGITLKIPNKYEEVVKDTENNTLELLNRIDGIWIKRNKSQRGFLDIK